MESTTLRGRVCCGCGDGLRRMTACVHRQMETALARAAAAAAATAAAVGAAGAAALAGGAARTARRPNAARSAWSCATCRTTSRTLRRARASQVLQRGLTRLRVTSFAPQGNTHSKAFFLSTMLTLQLQLEHALISVSGGKFLPQQPARGLSGTGARCARAQALRTKETLPLLQAARRALLLTGTPALSRPRELLTQVQALLPGAALTMRAFGERYCQGFSRFGQYQGARPAAQPRPTRGWPAMVHARIYNAASTDGMGQGSCEGLHGSHLVGRRPKGGCWPWAALPSRHAVHSVAASLSAASERHRLLCMAWSCSSRRAVQGSGARASTAPSAAALARRAQARATWRSCTVF